MLFTPVVITMPQQLMHGIYTTTQVLAADFQMNLG